MIELLNKHKIGIALSGGGAKGLSHLGALKAIEDIGLKIDLIAGVSAGAIVGAFYADGQAPEEICELLSKGNLYKMASLTKPQNGGLAKIDSYKQFLSKNIKARTFEELKYPLIINATELNSGKITYFEKGELIDCVIASASVPIFFTPTEINGKQYVDGGIFCNLPAAILRKKGCELVIGIHVNPINPMENISGILQLSERIFHLAVNGNTIEQKKKCDIVIEMSKTQTYGMFEANKAKEIYDIGYENAMMVLSQCDWEELLTRIKIEHSYPHHTKRP